MRRKGAAPTQQDLARVMGLTPIYVSKLLRALQAAGLVARVPDAADSRALRLSLTEEGVARIAKARAEVMTLDRRLTEPLGAPDDPNALRFRIFLHSLLAHHATMGDPE